MKTLITLLAFMGCSALMYAQSNLKFEKMIYIGNEGQKCPDGKIWEVQAVLNSYASLQEGFGQSFLSGMNGGQSDADAILKNQQKIMQLRIEPSWMIPSNFPFWVDPGTTLASGHKARMVVVAQYSVE